MVWDFYQNISQNPQTLNLDIIIFVIALKVNQWLWGIATKIPLMF